MALHCARALTRCHFALIESVKGLEITEVAHSLPRLGLMHRRQLAAKMSAAAREKRVPDIGSEQLGELSQYDVSTRLESRV